MLFNLNGQLFFFTSTVRKKAVSPLPISPATTSICNLVAKPFLMLMDHSASEASASNPVI
jgi:hypothetical protein